MSPGTHLTAKEDKDAKNSKAKMRQRTTLRRMPRPDAKADEGKEKSADKADKKARKMMRWPARRRRRRRLTWCSWPISIGSRRSSSGFEKWGKTRTRSLISSFKTWRSCSIFSIRLAKDDRFIDLRKRTRSHRILTKIEEATEEQRKDSLEEQNEVRERRTAANRCGSGRIPQENGGLGEARGFGSAGERANDGARANSTGTDAGREHRTRRKRAEQQVKQSERELASKIRGVQDRYKLLAVLLPPILPIVLAFFRVLQSSQGGAGRRRYAAVRFGKGKEPAA